MSKRALNAGLKAYPEKIIGTKNTPLDQNAPIDANIPARIYYMEGYKQAEKDTIERALDWLKYAQKKKMSFDAAIAYFKAIMEEK